VDPPRNLIVIALTNDAITARHREGTECRVVEHLFAGLAASKLN
jgi:hypothetical protein